MRKVDTVNSEIYTYKRLVGSWNDYILVEAKKGQDYVTELLNYEGEQLSLVNRYSFRI